MPGHLWILLFSLFFTLSPLEAAPPGSPQAVVDMRGIDPSDRLSMETALSSHYGRSIQLVDPEPAMVEILQWEPGPNAQSVCEERLRNNSLNIAWHDVPFPAGPASPFLRLLDEAAQQIDDIEYGRALIVLAAAREALQCETVLLEHDQVRRLFLMEAVTHAYLKDGIQQAAFLELLAVDSRPVGAEYNQSVRTSFLSAITQMDRTSPITLAPVANGQMLYLDGIPAGSITQVWPGRHILQRVGPANMVRTRLVQIAPLVSAEAKVPLDLGSLSDFGLPPSDVVVQSLATALVHRHLEPQHETGLARFLKLAGEDRIAFSVMPSTPGPPLIVEYSIDEGLIELHATSRTSLGNPESDTPDHSMSPVRHPLQAVAGLTLATQNLVGIPNEQHAFEINGHAFGPGLRVALAVDGFQLELRVEWYGLLARPRLEAESDACLHDLASQARCLPDAAPLSASLGTGFRYSAGPRVTLIPTVALQASYLRNTLIRTGDLAVATAKLDIPMVGAIFRGKLAYQMFPKRPGFQAGFEFSTGMLYWRTDGRTFAAVPLVLSTEVGTTF